MPSRAVVNRWLLDEANAAFRANYAQAREAFADAEFDGITQISDAEPERDDKGRIDPGWVAAQRLKIDARKWTLARMAPKKYGDKIELGGQLDVNSKIERITRRIVDGTGT